MKNYALSIAAVLGTFTGTLLGAAATVTHGQVGSASAVAGVAGAIVAALEMSRDKLTGTADLANLAKLAQTVEPLIEKYAANPNQGFAKLFFNAKPTPPPPAAVKPETLGWSAEPAQNKPDTPLL